MSRVVPLPARTDVAALARSAVACASASALRLSGVDGVPDLDADRIAVAYSSERWFRMDGRPRAGFAPLSAFFPTMDGWVRTHANYPHHRAALLLGLGLSRDARRIDADAEDVDSDAETRQRVAARLATMSTAAAAAGVTAAGGLCVAVRPEDRSADDSWRRHPLVEIRRLGDAPARPLPAPTALAPLRGVRVLDLTRVIAGPVATRTLALLGADVLRIDPPRLGEPQNQHLDTGHGKGSALLDLSSPAGRSRGEELLSGADVIALGYRPAALAALGLSPEAIAARHPGVVVLQLTAWGEPDRRGFDSLVQADSGIAVLEGDDAAPGALPAQALDHSAGYLLASAAMDLLGRRSREGGSWLASTSLRRIAAELLGLPRTAEKAPLHPLADAAGHTQDFIVDGIRITTAAPAVSYSGGPTAFAAPRPWGRDEPAWA